MQINKIEIKRCSNCGDKKSIDNFYFREDSKNYRNECKECHNKRSAIYYQNNRNSIRKQHKKFIKNKLKNNFILRLNNNISRNIRHSLHGNKNGRHWETLVGYTCNELERHLENLFQNNMTWKNYGKGKDKWHIDHIQPIDSFNIISAECKAFKECWALKNLQPLWGVDNIRKSNKLLWQAR